MRPNPARTKPVVLWRLRKAFGLPRDTRCSWCRAAQALPNQWYCKTCKAVKDRRRRVLAKRVSTGRLPLSAIPPKGKLSYRFFVRRPAWGTKAYGCSALGKRRWHQLCETLADQGIPQGAYMSWLASHRWHQTKGFRWSRACPICTRALSASGSR
jgi:hypothetical protein